MLLRLIWICCLIIGGAAATLWVLNLRPSHTEFPSDVTPAMPSVSFDDIEMIINSTEGKPQYKLHAPKYWLYDKEKRSEFEFPDIAIYRKNGSKVFAKALKGQTHEDNKVITLIGDVRIKQPQSQSDPHLLEIFTEKLIVYPKEQRATTDVDILATRGNQRLQAVGMSLDLDTQILYLHNDVNGRYDP